MTAADYHHSAGTCLTTWPSIRAFSAASISYDVRDVGELAESDGHHPDVSFGWGYATISLRTKKIKGLHENDFIMASKIDRMFGELERPPDRQ